MFLSIHAASLGFMINLLEEYIISSATSPAPVPSPK